jgi:hypothetical protein
VKNIEAVFNEFLIEQRQLLDIEKQEDYRDYEEVIDLFVQFSTSPTGSRNHLASFRFQNTFRLNV